MPSFCVVSNCELKYTHSENVSFHKFPLHDEKLLQKWTKFTDRGSDWKPSRWSSICSRHFVNDDFREFLSRKCLKKNAIPSVVTKNSISYETYHIADQSSTANSQYGDEDVSECNDDKETDSTTDVQSNENEKLQKISCRLCGDRIEEPVKIDSNIRIDGPEIGEMLRKCLPSINISRHRSDYLNMICQDCVSHLRRFSDFVDKVLTYQRDFERSNNSEMSLEHTAFEIRGSNSSSNSTNAPFTIKQEPINVKQEILDISNRKPQETPNVIKSLPVPSTSTISPSISNANDQRISVVEQSFIQWPRICGNTFCQLCERIFISNAEMNSHTCTGSQPPNIDHRVEPMNGTSSNNNCEIMEIITLNNPVSFIDLAEDEYATAEHATVCKKEIVIDVDRRERVDIEHAYAKRSAINTASSSCNLKQEIENNFDCERNDTVPINDATPVSSPHEISVDVDSRAQYSFICSKCGQEFSSNRLLLDHSNKMHSLKNRICAICSSEFKSTYEYLLHKNKVHVSGHRCQQCKRKFTTRLALKNHERHSCSIDSMDYYYSCRHCGKFMRNRVTMKEHLRSCVQNTKKDMNALVPSTNSNLDSDQNDFHIHNETATTKSFKCSRCHRSFKKEINFKRHTNKQCREKNSKTSCNSDIIGHCTDVMDVVGMDIVPATINTESDYMCHNKCGTKVSSVIEIQPVAADNKITNNNNKPSSGKYVCELCNKPFQAYANLKQHRTTHENEKKFICVLCPKKFKRISGLNQHVRGFHYKIKPFSCPVCSYSYALKGDMLRCRHSSLKKDVTHQ